MGRKLGLSDDEISKLASIPKSDFEYREWTALNYARDFATLVDPEETLYKSMCGGACKHRGIVPLENILSICNADGSIIYTTEPDY